MNSSIKVDFIENGNGLRPVISIKLVESDDVRDQLLKAFFQQLGGESNWLYVSFNNSIHSNDGYLKTSITILPVAPDELQETVSIITDRLGTSKGQSNYNPLLKGEGYTIV
ncbi:MAG TPA: hypothetical protein VN703_01150 [Candidatus Sulfopaludibacter sp.]|nr:hypothetical protein [Candidatus Sulfopaludibacter sp.]